MSELTSSVWDIHHMTFRRTRPVCSASHLLTLHGTTLWHLWLIPLSSLISHYVKSNHYWGICGVWVVSQAWNNQVLLRSIETESGLNMAPQLFPAKCTTCLTETGPIPCLKKKKTETSSWHSIMCSAFKLQHHAAYSHAFFTSDHPTLFQVFKGSCHWKIFG